MARHITARVGMKGAENLPSDVRTVQELLNNVPESEGGPKVPLIADGICGEKTKGAIQHFQLHHFGWKLADGRVDPGGPTLAKLNELAAEPRYNARTPRCIFPPDTQQGTQRSFAVGAGPGEITGFTLLEEARASLPMAKNWVLATLTKIKEVEDRIERFKVYTAADIDFFSSIETHFRVNIPSVSESVARDRLLKIRQMYQKIWRVLNVIATDRIVGNPGVPDKALAPLGGIDIPTEVMTIGRGFHNSNANMRAAVLIHEAGHFAHASCSHAASEQPAPNGSPILDQFGTAVNPGGLNYNQLDFNLHMQNAYSFAQCAMHNGLGIDKRPP